MEAERPTRPDRRLRARRPRLGGRARIRGAPRALRALPRGARRALGRRGRARLRNGSAHASAGAARPASCRRRHESARTSSLFVRAGSSPSRRSPQSLPAPRSASASGPPRSRAGSIAANPGLARQERWRRSCAQPGSRTISFARGTLVVAPERRSCARAQKPGARWKRSHVRGLDRRRGAPEPAGLFEGGSAGGDPPRPARARRSHRDGHRGAGRRAQEPVEPAVRHRQERALRARIRRLLRRKRSTRAPASNGHRRRIRKLRLTALPRHPSFPRRRVVHVRADHGCREPDSDLRSGRVPREVDGHIYANDGHTILATLRGSESRILVGTADIAPIMQQAIVAVEDKRFYEHRGVDLRGIGRAVWADITSKSVVQGGSTITQQFVKNSCVTTARTISRKLQGGRTRLAARAALEEAADPHRVSEHDLLRERRLRHSAGRADVLQHHRSRRLTLPRGGAAGRNSRRSVAVRSGDEPDERQGAGGSRC